MPRVGYSKESLEGPPLPDEGMYEVRLEGFEPKFSKEKKNINLNPVLKIVNHAKFNGVRVYDNLNTAAPWITEAFVHAFGMTLVGRPDGGADVPGEFPGPDDNPEQWIYQGPLVGLIGKIMVRRTEYQGRPQAKVDQWLCSASGCTQKHPKDLAK